MDHRIGVGDRQVSGKGIRNWAFNTDEQDHMLGGHIRHRFSSVLLCALWPVMSPFGP